MRVRTQIFRGREIPIDHHDTCLITSPYLPTQTAKSL